MKRKNSTLSYIRKLEAMGFHYNWDRFTDEQIYCIFMEKSIKMQNELVAAASLEKEPTVCRGQRRINSDTGEREVLTGHGWEKEYN